MFLMFFIRKSMFFNIYDWNTMFYSTGITVLVNVVTRESITHTTCQRL